MTSTPGFTHEAHAEGTDDGEFEQSATLFDACQQLDLRLRQPRLLPHCRVQLQSTKCRAPFEGHEVERMVETNVDGI